MVASLQYYILASNYKIYYNHNYIYLLVSYRETGSLWNAFLIKQFSIIIMHLPNFYILQILLISQSLTVIHCNSPTNVIFYNNFRISNWPIVYHLKNLKRWVWLKILCGICILQGTPKIIISSLENKSPSSFKWSETWT